MKKFFRTLTIAILILALSCNSIFAVAVDIESDVQPEFPEDYVHLASTSANINITSGVARVTSSGRSSVSTDTVYISVKLQRMANYTWTTLKTWSTSGTGHCALTATWNVPAGYTYRNFTTITVYNSSGSFVEMTYITSSQTY